MIISIALLGFGASGTLLAALERKGASTAARFQVSHVSWFAISATRERPREIQVELKPLIQ